MKKIEDYIDKEIGINCSNKKEFDEIVKLINVVKPNSKPTTSYCVEKRYILNLNNISSLIGVGDSSVYKSYTIYPATEFLELDEPRLIKNEFYVINFKDNPEYDSIFQSNGNLELKNRLWLNASAFNYADSGNWSTAYKFIFRKPTEDEIKWMKACIDANKLVSKEEALKPKFEVGKWYFDGTYYAKFHHLENSKFYHTCWIKATDKIYMKGYNGETHVGLITKYKPIDLSEIQQYLPEGHVDKIVKSLDINDLKIGEVYKATDSSIDWWCIFKASSKGNVTGRDGRIDILTNYISNSDRPFGISSEVCCKSGTKRTFQLATKEEEHQLECSIKANKFISLEESKTMKLEEELVGRYVRAIKPINCLKKNEYDLITGTIGCLFTCTKSNFWDKNRLGVDFELMPVGFKPNTELSKEELLEEAKKRYKDGDAFAALTANGRISGSRYTINTNFRSCNSDTCIANGGEGLIYACGKWAEIVSLPEEIKQDSFVLPEYWHIDVNKESLDSINKYRLNTKFPKPLSKSYLYYGISSDYKTPQGWTSIIENSTKITLEQFRKYVLKENVVESLVERLIPLQQEVLKTCEKINKEPGFDFQNFNFDGALFQIEREVKSVIKPINKIELNLKKTNRKSVVKQRKQLTIIKTKQLKLN